MKQHYNKCICTVLVMLLIAAYFVNVRKATNFKNVGKPKPLSAKTKGNPAAPADEKTIASIQQSLAKREYNISFDSEKNTLQSPNRKQGIRAYYKPGVLTVNNRVDSAGHNFSLKLVNEGIFADGKKILSPQTDAVLENTDNKLVIKHQGFSEEFINNEEGVRQNFIIDSAPKSTRELQVKLSAKGLKVNDLQNNELQFLAENKDGEITNSLIYKDIKCWDADGQTLPATLNYEDGIVLLSVSVQNAAYPVTIDPIVVNGNPTNATAMVESNQATAWMGGVVASAGDVNGDGYSDILVAASMYDNGESNEGVVFLYNGNASGINTAAPVLLEANQKEARFGAFASSAGDINKDGFSDIIIGAHMFDKGQTNEGAAFIYYGSAQGISKVASLVLESNQPEANMGNAVGLAGDVNGDGYSDVAVCARAYSNGQSKEGVVFIYHGSAAGLNTTPVLIEQNQPESMFGFCATSAGDVNGDGYSDITIGARTFDKGETDEGAVFIYHGSALGINPAAAATVLESNQKEAYLGHTVASAGDVNGDGYSDIIVGANMYDKGQANEGAAFVHYGSAQGVNVAAAVVLEKNQAEAQMGYSVASAGDVNGDGYADVIVGAMYYDNGQSNEGAAFVYQGSSTGLSATPASTLESNQAGALFGSNVSSAGDVNGDGYSDVLVGAIVYNNGQAGEGAAFVWLGKADGIVSSMNTSGSLKFDQQRTSVAGAGDVNGDGFSDLLVGIPNYDSHGAVFIYHGSAQGIGNNPNTVIENVPGSDMFGFSIASAGDINGDGYGDVVIGDMGYFISWINSTLLEGAALVYYGSPSGINKNVNTVLESKSKGNSSSMGWAVSSAGDVNGDGYGDIIVGDPNYDIKYDVQFDEGAVYIYHGSANGINPVPAIILQGAQSTCQLGYSVSNGGDINSDGYSDIVLGAPSYLNAQFGAGAVFVHLGSSSGISKNSVILLEKNGLGVSVASAGDVNGDGYGDIIAGADNFDNGIDDEGAAFLYYGSPMGMNPVSVLLECNIQNAHMGSSVSGAGDLNGDGYSDIIVSAPDITISQNLKGKAFVYYGSSNGIASGATPSFSIENTNQIEPESDTEYYVSNVGDLNGDGYSDIATNSYYTNFDSMNEKGVIQLYNGNNNKNLQNNLRLYNSNLTTPINQTQKAKNDFGAGLYAKSFLGKNKGKMIWETKAKGQGFSKGANNVITNSTISSGSQNAYAALGLTGTELKSVIAKQGPSTKVRVRVKYDPALALTGQLYGPWRYLPAYLLGNSIAPAPEDLVDDMSETVRRKVESAELSDGEKVLVYPNPVSDKLFIETDHSDLISHVQLLTSNGKSVCKTSQREIDVKGIESGVYILVISRKDGSQTSHKVSINKYCIV